MEACPSVTFPPFELKVSSMTWASACGNLKWGGSCSSHICSCDAIGCRIVFVFLPKVLFFFGFLSRCHLPCVWNSLELEPRHFAWYVLHFGMVTLHFAWYLLHLAMFAFHFGWYLSHFGISTFHLRGICYILVLQTFMCVSGGFFRLCFIEGLI